VSSNPVYGKVYSIQHYVIKFVSDYHDDPRDHDDPRHDLALLNTLNNGDQKDIQLFS
jgi:hypothetical protein